MEKIIQFIESFSTSKKHYFRCSLTYHPETQVEIAHFGKRLTDKWALKQPQDEDWSYYSAQDFIDAANNAGVNLYDLELNLNNTARTMAVYANMVLKEAQVVLGKEAVDEAIEEYRKFGEQLLATVQKLVGQTEKPKNPADKPKPSLTLL